MVQTVAERPSVDQALDLAAAALRDAPEVSLACHVNPDPDALGSMFGLAGFLAARGTHVICSWGTKPLNPPRWMAALDGAGFLVQPDRFPSEPSLMVALDT